MVALFHFIAIRSARNPTYMLRQVQGVKVDRLKRRWATAQLFRPIVPCSIITNVGSTGENDAHDLVLAVVSGLVVWVLAESNAAEVVHLEYLRGSMHDPFEDCTSRTVSELSFVKKLVDTRRL